MAGVATKVLEDHFTDAPSESDLKRFYTTPDEYGWHDRSSLRAVR